VELADDASLGAGIRQQHRTTPEVAMSELDDFLTPTLARQSKPNKR
jgi:hypothetical protein